MPPATSDGLRGEEIPIGGRILGAAEVFDALSTSRAYQEKMSPKKAVERAADLSGTVLDPRSSKHWPRWSAAAPHARVSSTRVAQRHLTGSVLVLIAYGATGFVGNGTLPRC